jgi:uncharacterized cupin superfamily protein
MEQEQEKKNPISVIETPDPVEHQQAITQCGDLVTFKNGEWVLWPVKT